MSPERVLTEVDGRELSLSNLDKVLYPDTGFTKSQMLDYLSLIHISLGESVDDFVGEGEDRRLWRLNGHNGSFELRQYLRHRN